MTPLTHLFVRPLRGVIPPFITSRGNPSACEMSRPYSVQLPKLWKNSNGKAADDEEFHPGFCGGRNFIGKPFPSDSDCPSCKMLQMGLSNSLFDNTRFISNLLLGKWGEEKYGIFRAKPLLEMVLGD